MQSDCPGQDRASISTQWVTWTKYINFAVSCLVKILTLNSLQALVLSRFVDKIAQ